MMAGEKFAPFWEYSKPELAENGVYFETATFFC